MDQNLMVDATQLYVLFPLRCYLLQKMSLEETIELVFQFLVHRFFIVLFDHLHKFGKSACFRILVCILFDQF